MTDLVNEYNACGRDDYEPNVIFTEWLESGTYACTTCSKEFKISDLHESPSPQAEVTCGSCVTSSEDEDAAASA
jgi:DNA-directed RNA polymerase subunit RPC12/RpoP